MARLEDTEREVEKASQHHDSLREQARDALHGFKEQLESAGRRAKEQVNDLTDKTKEHLDEIGDKAKIVVSGAVLLAGTELSSLTGHALPPGAKAIDQHAASPVTRVETLLERPHVSAEALDQMTEHPAGERAGEGISDDDKWEFVEMLRRRGEVGKAIERGCSASSEQVDDRTKR